MDSHGPTGNACAHEAITVGGRKRCARCGLELAPEFSGAGKKLDAGKPRYDLLPTKALRAYVDVLTYGERKYEANGWMKVVGWRWRYMRAGLTHAFAYISSRLAGVAVPLDVETGLPELAHAMCCFSFVLDNDLALQAGSRTVPDGDAPAPPESQVETAVVGASDFASVLGAAHLPEQPKPSCFGQFHLFVPGEPKCMCGVNRAQAFGGAP